MNPGQSAMTKNLAVFASTLSLVGAAFTSYVVLVRIPALAVTKLDLLLGTLQGVAVGLLFAIAASLVSLHTWFTGRTVRRPSRRSAIGSLVRASEPIALRGLFRALRSSLARASIIERAVSTNRFG